MVFLLSGYWKQHLTSSFTAPITIVQRKPKINHKINQVTGTTSRQSNSTITMVLLFGDNKLDFETNEILLTSTVRFTSLTERFICPLFE